ncbi:hypothetical protein OROMI_011649 [Orobanche minor]
MGIQGTQVAKESSNIIILDDSFASVVKADIGLSMGIQGTEVAKESSYIIILDNSFASVVKVVLWGRSVYANIQKLIQFELTVNVAALVINVVAAISLGDVSLITVQALMHTFMKNFAIILSLIASSSLVIKMRPCDASSLARLFLHGNSSGKYINLIIAHLLSPLVENIMWRNLIIQAIYQVAVLLVLNLLLQVSSIHDSNLAKHLRTHILGLIQEALNKVAKG